MESIINKCEEDERKNEGMAHEKQAIQSSSNYNYNDNCSDSGSSFNQVTFTSYDTQNISESNIEFHY